jgi:predicted CopG family antitoxin
MYRKLTISIDDEVYQALHKTIGRRKISQFIEQLIRPYVLKTDLERSYFEMKEDRHRESEAMAWSENFIGDGYINGDSKKYLLPSPNNP